jgi:hypothetical protein
MCIKFINICKEHRPLDRFYKYGASQTCGAPDCPVPRLVCPTNRSLSGKLNAPPIKFIGLSGVHQTIRWAHDQWSTSPTIDCHRDCHHQKQSEVRNGQQQSGHPRLSGVPPDCPVRHRGRMIHWSTSTNANNWETWQAPDNEQCQIRCAPVCPVRPSIESCCFCSTAINVVGAINTPQPPPFSTSKHSINPHSIQEQGIHSKTHSKLPISSSATIKTSD